jgi:hypothetical protein
MRGGLRCIQSERRLAHSGVLYTAKTLSARAVYPKFLLVLDLEATCGGNISNGDQEIIELPTVLYSVEEDQVKTTFHEYVRPTRNPILTELCTHLTGINQVRAPISLSLSLYGSEH